MCNFFQQILAKLLNEDYSDRKELKCLCKCLKRYNIFRQPPSSLHKKDNTPILCFGWETGWSNILSGLLNKECISITTTNMCNEQIAHDIINHCNIHSPVSIYVLFSDLFDLPDYTTNELTTITYNYILELNKQPTCTPLSQMSNFYLQEYEGINMFLRFVHIFKYVEVYCKARNINFYWHTPSLLIKLLSYEQIKKYLNVNTIFTDKNRIKTFIKNENFLHEQLAKDFFKITR